MTHSKETISNCGTHLTIKNELSYSYPEAMPKHGFKLNVPKPRTHGYHYSNEESQGALICETKNFPGWFDREKESTASAYSDRIRSWDSNRYDEACKLAGQGDQGWGYSLPKLNTEKLKAFAKIALDLTEIPTHVQVFHYYGTNGYSCPVIIAIYPKTTSEVKNFLEQERDREERSTKYENS